MYVLKEPHIYPSAQELAAEIFHTLQNAPSPSPHLNDHVLGRIRHTMGSVQTNIEQLTKDPRAQIYIREDYWEELVAEAVFTKTAKLVLALTYRRVGLTIEEVVGEGPMVQAWRESRPLVDGLLDEFPADRNTLLESMIYLSTLAILVLVSPPVFRMLGFEADFPVDKSFADEAVGGIPYEALLTSLRRFARMHGRPLFAQDLVVTVPDRADTGVLAGMMNFLESD